MLILLFILKLTIGILYEPEQVHIAWACEDNAMTVTWAAQYPSVGASVEYTPINATSETVSSYQFKSLGLWTTFPNLEYPNILQRHLHVCSAKMENLNLGGLYAYRVGSEIFGWSKQFVFKAKKNFDQDELARLIVYGDLGIGDQIVATMIRLEEEINRTDYDAFIHDGDFAYDLNSYQGEYGDIFLRSIEPVASRVPYMVSQGNHEAGDSVLQYNYRFNMPGDSLNFWYSFNAGRAHFVSFTTEFLFDNLTDMQEAQRLFLEKDLETYDREKYPWLIVFGHRPPYCSANMTTQIELGDGPPRQRHNTDCLVGAPIVRSAFEDLWYKYKVDLMISAHVHAYERFTPVYQNHSMPCEYEDLNTYINPSAPVYVITGTPGQQESYAPDSPTPLPFSIVQDDHLGYSRLTIFNSTYMLWEQIRSVTQEIADTLWIIKNNQR